jgi:hypothetical protein
MSSQTLGRGFVTKAGTGSKKLVQANSTLATRSFLVILGKIQKSFFNECHTETAVLEEVCFLDGLLLSFYNS